MASTLRDRPSLDAVASMNRHVVAKRASEALDRRLDRLEHERVEILRSLDACERAIRWLGPQDRLRARRRLRDLGYTSRPAR